MDLVVPMKHPRDGKSRLRGAVEAARHPGLVLALAADTLAAVTSSAHVRRVLLVAADPEAVGELAQLGVEIVLEPAEKTLNAAFRHGADLLRKDDPHSVVGALQADLPALRAGDLADAFAEAAGRRAFVADRQGTGTTLLLAAPGAPSTRASGRVRRGSTPPPGPCRSGNRSRACAATSTPRRTSPTFAAWVSGNTPPPASANPARSCSPDLHRGLRNSA